MEARLFEGLVVTERSAAEMPAHVRADENYLPLARIG